MVTRGIHTVRAGALLLAMLLTACATTDPLERYACERVAGEDLAQTDVDLDALFAGFARLPEPNSNRARRDALHSMFHAAGCRAPDLLTQETRWVRHSNVVCELPGRREAVIVVGAHYDKTSKGRGAVDNWSGASMLPSLYHELARAHPRFTWRFIGFGGEERDLAGSKAYVDGLGSDEIERVVAMVNLDSFGLHAIRVDPRSSPDLACAAMAASNRLGLPLTGSALGPPIMGDFQPFQERGIPVLNLHALTRNDLGMLHSRDDRVTRVKRVHYVDSYRLISGLLRLLDGSWTPVN